MTEQDAQLVLTAFGAWLGVGVLSAILFLSFGISRVDASAAGAGLLFKATIFLGCVLLWPAILLRWASGRRINEADEA